MKQIKCITFDKDAQDNLPQHIKDKMKANMEKSIQKSTVKQTVIDVLILLAKKQNSYADPAEHVYDACNTIRRHLDDEDLINYVGDFIWGLNSPTNADFDGTLSKCVKMLRGITTL